MKIERSRSVACHWVLLAFGLIAGTPSTASSLPEAQNHAEPLIVERVDEAKRIVLTGNTRPEASRAEFDRGEVEAAFPLNGMQLQLRRSAAHQQEAEDWAEELHRSGSPIFHQWLSSQQYAEKFGDHPNGMVRISDWLRGHGFTV